MILRHSRSAHILLIGLLGSVGAYAQPTQASPARRMITLSPFGPNSYFVSRHYVPDPSLPDGRHGIPGRTLRIVLRGMGFAADNPSGNAILIDGVPVPVLWDGCSNMPVSTASTPVQIHGQVVGPETIILCGVPAPAGDQMSLAVGNGDSMSFPQVLHIASVTRAQSAMMALGVVLVMALIPVVLLRYGGASRSWTALFRDAGSGVYSLSRFQFYVWTVTFVFAYAYVYSSTSQFSGSGFPDLPASVLTLIGISALTMLASIGIASAASSPVKARTPSLADLITVDGSVAPDRLQFFILMILVGPALYLVSLLRPQPSSLVDLPASPSWMLGLAGISAAVYLAGRVLRSRAVVAYAPADQDTLVNPTYREIEVLRAKRKQAEEDQASRNLEDTFLLRSFGWKDVRFFQDGVYTFAPRVNVLLGRNGYGKSLLLRTLAAVVQGDLENSALLFAAAAGSGSPAQLKLAAERNGKGDETARDADDFSKTMGKVPLLAIPDARFVNRAARRITPSPVPSRLNRNGAQSFLKQEPFENVILDLLAKLGLDYERGPGFDQPLFRLIEKVVRDLTEDEKFAFYRIERGEDTAFEILVKTAGNEDRPLAIQSASQGTLSVLAMFGLIYMFLQSLRPNLKADAVPSAAGIVLIDELDAHLHPRWQQRIMGLLTGTFPNVQFIVSAHSPLIVAGCDRNEVSVLRRDTAADRFVFEPIERDFLGVDTAELYKTIFDIEEVDRLYLEYSNKVASGALERTLSDINRLEAKTKRTAEEEAQLNRLWQERRLIEKAAKVRQKKLAEGAAQANVERLQNEIDRLNSLLDKEKGTGV